MFEKFLSDNIDNFRQRYEGTFGFFRNEQGKRLLVKITSITPDRCDFEAAGNVSFHISPDVEENIGFEFLPPKSQWYNTPDGAMYVERIAQRQFQRGITGKNIVIYGLKDGYPEPVQVSFKNLSMIFESKEIEGKALRELLGKKPVAIAPSFAFDKKGAIWLFREHIGGYIRDKSGRVMVKLNQPDVWKTELNDALSSLGLTSEIA